MSAEILWPCRVSCSASLRVDLVVQRSGDMGSPRDVGLDQREECLPNGWVQVDDAPAAGARPTDTTQRGLSAAEFPHSGRHSGLTDTGGTSNRSDPVVAEGLGLRPYRQATLPLVEVRHNRLELGCQRGPLPIQPAHARPTNHQAESHELKICTPLGTRIPTLVQTAKNFGSWPGFLIESVQEHCRESVGRRGGGIRTNDQGPPLCPALQSVTSPPPIRQPPCEKARSGGVAAVAAHERAPAPAMRGLCITRHPAREGGMLPFGLGWGGNS